MSDEKKAEELSSALTHVLEECRMVLPGIQALFGFQLIAVFSDGFRTQLEPAGKVLHLASIVLVALAIALVMTPAAYHRQIEPEGVSEDFIALSSKLLVSSMVPLGIATSLELFLIAAVVLEERVVAAFLGVGLAGVFGALWFVLPRVHVRRAGTDRSRGRRGLAAAPKL